MKPSPLIIFYHLLVLFVLVTNIWDKNNYFVIKDREHKQPRQICDLQYVLKQEATKWFVTQLGNVPQHKAATIEILRLFFMWFLGFVLTPLYFDIHVGNTRITQQVHDWIRSLIYVWIHSQKIIVVLPIRVDPVLIALPSVCTASIHNFR